MKDFVQKIKLLCAVFLIKKKITVEDVLVLTTDRSVAPTVLASFDLLKQNSNESNSWIGLVKNNINFLFVNHALDQNTVLYRPKIVCVYDSYVNKTSPLFLASMLVRWASILQDRSDYDSAEAKKKQIDFLSCVATHESDEIVRYLKEYYT